MAEFLAEFLIKKIPVNDQDSWILKLVNLDPVLNCKTQNMGVGLCFYDICSELVDYTRSYLQTDKFELHCGLDYNLW